MKEYVDIGFRIKKINDLLLKKADEQMQEMNLTFSQHHILIYLIHCENHISTLKAIEHKFHVSQATMAGIVKRMEEKQIVSSYISPTDRRIKLVELTDKGYEICEKSKIMMERSEKKMRSLYSSEEMKQFDLYLDRLYSALSKEEE